MVKPKQGCSNHRRSMDAGDLAPLVTEFMAHLRALGHSCLTVSGYEGSARHFACWLTRERLAVGNVDEDVVSRFARHRCRCPGIRRVKGVSEKYVRRARRFVDFLGERGIVRREPKSTSPAFDRHVIEFPEWLRHHRGITELTIGRHGRMVMRLLPALGRRSQSWDAQLIRDVILAETKRASLAYVSVFEPSTEIIRKGKAGKPNEFGKMVKLQEAENQIVIDYDVYDQRPSDSELLIPAIETHEAKLGRTPRLVAADAGFYSARNEAAAKARGVKRVCIPNRSTKSAERKREQKKRWFRNGQKWRTGCEGRISVVKRRHGLDRCRYKGSIGMKRWVGLGVVADNLINIGRAMENQSRQP